MKSTQYPLPSFFLCPLKKLQTNIKYLITLRSVSYFDSRTPKKGFFQNLEHFWVHVDANKGEKGEKHAIGKFMDKKYASRERSVSLVNVSPHS